MDSLIPDDIIAAIANAHRVAVLTGAGISAESGIPTFREAQTGLWTKYAPEELASEAAFRRNPELVWRWYSWRRQLVAAAEPNPGHLALAAMEEIVPVLTIITQNVDGLHQRAGSRTVLELHGNIARNRCMDHGGLVEMIDPVGGDPFVPKCPQCGGVLRPDVVWFGESLPRLTLSSAVEATDTADVFFSIGTSAVVQPAASLPLRARQRGAVTIEINPADTPVSPYMDYRLRGPAAHILPSLLKRLTR